MLVVYCQKRRKKALKKARRKNKGGNKVGDSFSDSDVPREPIVIHQPADHGFAHNDSTMNNSNVAMMQMAGAQ